MRFLRSTTVPKSQALLFVPDLDRWLANVSRRPKTLDWWFRVSDVKCLDPNSAAAELVTGQAVGAAPLTRMLEGPTPPDSVWVHIGFVNLRPDLSAVWLSSGSRLPDQQSLDALTELFEQFGLRFEVAASGHAYARLKHLSSVIFTPPWQTHGMSLDHVLPRGPEALFWIQLITESQILLRDLARQGADTHCESVWPWGLGAVPADAPRSSFTRLQADATDLIAAARWAALATIEPGATRLGVPRAAELVEWHGAEGLSAEAQLLAICDWLKSGIRSLLFRRIDEVAIATRTHCRRINAVDLWPWRWWPDKHA